MSGAETDADPAPDVAADTALGAEAAPEEEPSEQSLVGQLIADRYEVEKLLGMGAMGAVYRARHVHMQKAVALKVLHQETSENAEVVTRFEREAIAAGRIAHPNVAGATDFGRLPDGAFYLVLEYVAGKSLGALLEEEGALPLERALSITEQIVSALAAAHHHEIVHRDLKPENVMLLEPAAVSMTATVVPASRATMTDGEIVKVLDFGLAKLQKKDNDDTQLTMVGAVYGTPQYMSPEQAAGQEVDHRADLYAVGLMLYEMLTGAPPFTAEQMMPLLIKQMTEAPAPLPSSIPKDVRKLVMKLLEKDPSDRYPSADALFEALHAVSPGEAGAGARTPKLPSVASLPDMGQVGKKVGDLSVKAKTLGAAAITASGPALDFLKADMEVKGKTFPRWVPAAGLASGLVLVLVVLLSGGEESPGAEAEGPLAQAGAAVDRMAEGVKEAGKKLVEEDPELLRLAESTMTGSPDAFIGLKRVEESERTETVWLGLAYGHLMRKEVEEALHCYGEAIEANDEHQRDKALVGALRRLADDDEYAEDILEFVAERFGRDAPDFLFHVWSTTSQKTLATTEAKSLLESGQLKSRWSPALQIAMDLREAGEDCQDAQELLGRVIEDGDERCLARLRKYRKQRGCGSSGRDDCYACMRDKTGKKNSAELDEAWLQANQRKAPSYPLLRRWRWR